MIDWLLYFCLLAVLVVGLALTIMTFPGLWLIVGAAAVYALVTQFAFISGWTLLVLLGIAALGEVMETTSAGAAAKRAGGTRRGAWGALIGGLLGAILLTIPLWIIGTLIGACIGTFVGAMIGELSGGREVGSAAWVGVSAARGRFVGTLLKLGFGCVMSVVIVWTALPLQGRRAAPGLTTAPATASHPGTGPVTRP